MEVFERVKFKSVAESWYQFDGLYGELEIAVRGRAKPLMLIRRLPPPLRIAVI